MPAFLLGNPKVTPRPQTWGEPPPSLASIQPANTPTRRVLHVKPAPSAGPGSPASHYRQMNNSV